MLRLRRPAPCGPDPGCGRHTRAERPGEQSPSAPFASSAARPRAGRYPKSPANHITERATQLSCRLAPT